MKSTLAAEALALIECAEAAVHIRRLLMEVTRCRNIPVKCFVDNKSLLDSLNSKKNVTDKRLRIDLCVIQDMLKNKEVDTISWVSTSDQLADCLTKKGASTRQLRSAISRD